MQPRDARLAIDLLRQVGDLSMQVAVRSCGTCPPAECDATESKLHARGKRLPGYQRR
jgi:hypothetical protein